MSQKQLADMGLANEIKLEISRSVFLALQYNHPILWQRENVIIGPDTHNLNNFELWKCPYNFHTYCPLFEDVT